MKFLENALGDRDEMEMEWFKSSYVQDSRFSVQSLRHSLFRVSFSLNSTVSLAGGGADTRPVKKEPINAAAFLDYTLGRSTPPLAGSMEVPIK
jgi:hypothetical protein